VSDIQIKKVTTKRDLRRFIRFPWKVYEGDPNWVPPLIMDVKEKLNEKKHPFFKHAEVELFLAYRDDRLTGRIAAILDNSHNDYHKEKVVFFGMYESLDDFETARSLLDRVSRWGQSRGMEVIRGPVNLSMNDECAFLLEGFDSPPVIMMAYNPPYYIDLMEKCGLSKAKDLYAFFMTREHKEKDKVRAIAEKTRRETKINLRKVDLKNIEEEAEKIRFIYNSAWAENWGFVPWTDGEMQHMAKKLKQLADPALIIIAEHRDRPVGFAFGMPNYNEVLQKLNGRLFPLGIFKLLYYKNRIKGLRAVVFGILKEYRMSGLSYLLYSEFEKNGIERGYQWGETSWQLEDNDAVNRFTESIGGHIYKKYRIFENKIV